MEKTTMGRRRRSPWLLGLLLGALVCGLAEAAKPSSGPQLLTGTGGYVETPLFGSDEVMQILQGESALNPVSGSTSMADVTQTTMTRGVEVDASGAVYAIFDSTVVLDAVTGAMNRFSGIVRYEDGAGVQVSLARAFYYDGVDDESAQGEYIADMDLVPTLNASATGPLQAGDLVVSRWTDTTDITDPDSPLADDRLEIVLFRPDASGNLVEQQILRSFDGLYGDLVATQVAVDGSGNLYARFLAQHTGYLLDTGLYRLTYDANAEAYVEEAISFPFETNQYFDVDEVGNLYVQGAFGGPDSAVVFKLPAGKDPATGYFEYAAYEHRFGAWTADNADANGTLAMFLRRSSPRLNYVALLAETVDAAYADRIAESESWGVHAMTADASGSIYVAHEDRTATSNGVTVVDGSTIYRLDVDTSGGGDSGGGGKGGGKGKNK